MTIYGHVLMNVYLRCHIVRLPSSMPDNEAMPFIHISDFDGIKLSSGNNVIIHNSHSGD